MREITANERRELILEALYHRRKDTILKLAEEFGVSSRTINSDIQMLSLSHPIETIQGNGGGVKIMDGCYSNKKYLRKDQQKLLEKLNQTLSGDELLIMDSIFRDFAPGGRREVKQ